MIYKDILDIYLKLKGIGSHVSVDTDYARFIVVFFDTNELNYIYDTSDKVELLYMGNGKITIIDRKRDILRKNIHYLYITSKLFEIL